MPEGDTVWRAARTMHKALAGQPATADFRVPQLATTPLAGTVLESASRGKHLLTRFDTGDTLHTHLKMEGSWHLYRPGERWRRPTHEVRVVLTTPEWVAVGFALGIVELVRTDAEDRVVGHLGPDLLGADWDLDEAVRRLAADPARELGDALIDQRNLAGLGNLYKSEICFIAGHHPRTPIGEIADLRRVVERSQRLLWANRERIEQTTTGDLRRGRTTYVYRRAGQPCRRCGTRVLADQQGRAGQERASFWCPSCQPAPDPQ